MADKKGGKGGGKKNPSVSYWYVLSVPLIVVVLLAIIWGWPFLTTLDYSGAKPTIDFALGIWRDIARPIFIGLDIILVGLLVFLLFVIYPINPTVSLFKIKPKRPIMKNPALAQQWHKIKQQAGTGTPENLRLAIIAADNLVDDWLKKSGYQGTSFAERISVIKADQVKSFKAMWQAHRLRNDLVHTPDFKITTGQAHEALEAYQAFLREMGGI